MTPLDVDIMLRGLQLKDLRVQTRVRGLSPAGGVEALRERLKETMLQTGDFALKTETGENQVIVDAVAGSTRADTVDGKLQNNYARPGGQQNVGNFLSERNSSRVLAPPGGVSQIVFGDAEPAGSTKFSGRSRGSTPADSFNPITGESAGGQIGSTNNNYHRSAGQNVGNMITDRPSSRVLAPPGGHSQIVLG